MGGALRRALARAMTVDEPRLRASPPVRARSTISGVAIPEQRLASIVDAGDRERGERAQQRRSAALAGVARDRDVRPVAEDRRRRAASAPGPGRPRRRSRAPAAYIASNLLREPHRLRDLRGEQRAHAVGRAGYGAAVVFDHTGIAASQIVDARRGGRASASLRAGDERAVERARDRDLLRADQPGGARRASERRLDRGGRARDHGLLRRVVVGDHDAACPRSAARRSSPSAATAAIVPGSRRRGVEDALRRAPR